MVFSCPAPNMNSSNILSYLILKARRFYPWKNKFERVMQSDGQECLWQKAKNKRDEVKLLHKMGLFINDSVPWYQKGRDLKCYA